MFFFILFFSLQGCRKEEIVITQAFQNLLYLGLYVAEDGGFFNDEGLSVRIETAGGDAQAFSALTSGKCDFAQGDPSFVAIAAEKGWDGKVIASVVNRAAIWGVTFNQSFIKIDSIQQLQGKTIAVFPNPNTSYVIQKQLTESSGLSWGKDIGVIEVPFGTELATLRSGRADVAQTLEPVVSEVELQGGKAVISYPDFFGPIAFSGLMVSQKTISQNPEMIRKVIHAYNRALSYIHEDIDGATKIAMKYFPDMDKEVVKSAVRRLVESESIPSSTEVTPKAWEKLLEIRLSVGDIQSMPEKQLYDNCFIGN